METLVSSAHDNRKEEISIKEKKICKNMAVLDYNKYMGGIDLNGGLLTSYASTRIKHKKYYTKEFKHLIDFTCLNAYIIYNKSNSAILRFDFMMSLINNMIELF